ncbi:hypothetical protein [Paenibacillus agaridevorans]|uniref:hypothetical protein n=1 Tax=Paenibacillus agaridevorans TaxID=171404 RepID=UPI001BE41537|nr:hypothetical protein [Paenibacillus agaridevorans]
MSKKKATSSLGARNHDDELIELDKEFQQFKLEEFTVEYPSEDAITRTIDAMRPYVTQAAAPRDKYSCLGQLRLMQIQPLFWLANLLFFCMGLLVWYVWEGDPYKIMLLLSPIPFLLGLLEVFRGRNEGLLELEISCKYSAQQLLLMKLIVICAYNILLCLTLIGVFGLFGEPLLLSKLLMYWTAPFAVAVSVGLAVASRVRNVLSVPIALVIWLFIAYGFLTGLEYYEQASELPYIAGLATVFVAACIAKQIQRLKKGFAYYEAVH